MCTVFLFSWILEEDKLFIGEKTSTTCIFIAYLVPFVLFINQPWLLQMNVFPLTVHWWLTWTINLDLFTECIRKLPLVIGNWRTFFVTTSLCLHTPDSISCSIPYVEFCRHNTYSPVRTCHFPCCFSDKFAWREGRKIYINAQQVAFMT